MNSAAPSEAVRSFAWIPCPVCWGQRRVFVASGDGEGYVPEVCTPCLGLGEVLTGTP
jgi:hypothetical protein